MKVYKDLNNLTYEELYSLLKLIEYRSEVIKGEISSIMLPNGIKDGTRPFFDEKNKLLNLYISIISEINTLIDNSILNRIDNPVEKLKISTKKLLNENKKVKNGTKNVKKDKKDIL